MDIDRSRLYENVHDYLETSGFTTMKLARTAALELCDWAAERGIVIVMVEGGIFREGTFEARGRRQKQFVRRRVYSIHG
jgi:hypothetical protein